MLRCPASKFITHTLSNLSFLVLLTAATFRLNEKTYHPITSTSDLVKHHFDGQLTYEEQTLALMKNTFRPTNVLMTNVQICLMFWILGKLHLFSAWCMSVLNKTCFKPYTPDQCPYRSHICPSFDPTSSAMLISEPYALHSILPPQQCSYRSHMPFIWSSLLSNAHAEPYALYLILRPSSAMLMRNHMPFIWSSGPPQQCPYRRDMSFPPPPINLCLIDFTITKFRRNCIKLEQTKCFVMQLTIILNLVSWLFNNSQKLRVRTLAVC